MRRAWQQGWDRAEATFWRVAAAVTGLAVRHRRVARVMPLVLLALGAFFAGRATGTLLTRLP